MVPLYLVLLGIVASSSALTCSLPPRTKFVLDPSVTRPKFQGSQWNTTANWEAFTERAYCLLLRYDMLSAAERGELDERERGGESPMQLGSHLYALLLRRLPAVYKHRGDEGGYVKDGGALLEAIHSLRACPRGITLCNVIKDEARNLHEWLVFHLIMGVERFVMFEDYVGKDRSEGARDVTQETLRPFIDAGVVELYGVSGEDRLATALSECHAMVKRQGRDTWLINSFDPDEFLYAESGVCLGDFLEPYNGYAGVVVQGENVAMRFDDPFSRPPHALALEHEAGNPRVRSIIYKTVARVKWTRRCETAHECLYVQGAPPVVDTYHRVIVSPYNTNPPLGPAPLHLLHFRKQSFEDLVRKRLKGCAFTGDRPEALFPPVRLLHDIMTDLSLVHQSLTTDYAPEATYDITWASSCVKAVLAFHADGARGRELIGQACRELLGRSPSSSAAHTPPLQPSPYMLTFALHWSPGAMAFVSAPTDAAPAECDRLAESLLAMYNRTASAADGMTHPSCLGSGGSEEDVRACTKRALMAMLDDMARERGVDSGFCDMDDTRELEGREMREVVVEPLLPPPQLWDAPTESLAAFRIAI